MLLETRVSCASQHKRCVIDSFCLAEFEMLTQLDDCLGYVDEFDFAYVMDNYGNAVRVPFSLGVYYFQDH